MHSIPTRPSDRRCPNDAPERCQKVRKYVFAGQMPAKCALPDNPSSLFVVQAVAGSNPVAHP